MDWRVVCFRMVCKSCKMASTSSRLAPDCGSRAGSSRSLSSVVNAAASTVSSSSESSQTSSRTLATSLPESLLAIATPVVGLESNVQIGRVVDHCVWSCESWCDVFHMARLSSFACNLVSKHLSVGGFRRGWRSLGSLEERLCLRSPAGFILACVADACHGLHGSSPLCGYRPVRPSDGGPASKRNTPNGANALRPWVIVLISLMEMP